MKRKGWSGHGTLSSRKAKARGSKRLARQRERGNRQ